MYIRFWSIVANNLYLFGAVFWVLTCLTLLLPLVVLFFKVNSQKDFPPRWRIVAKVLALGYFLFTVILPLYVGVVTIIFLLFAPWGEKLAFWQELLWYVVFSLPAFLTALVHFWPIFWRKSLYQHWGVLVLGLCQELVTLVASFIFAYQLFRLDGYTFLKNVVLIWQPQRQLTEILVDVAHREQLPQSKKQLLHDYSELREIKDYGRWCYFYRADEDDFYFVAEYSRLWFIYDRSGEVERTYRPKESSWRWLINRCRWTQWI